MTLRSHSLDTLIGRQFLGSEGRAEIMVVVPDQLDHLVPKFSGAARARASFALRMQAHQSFIGELLPKTTDLPRMQLKPLRSLL